MSDLVTELMEDRALIKRAVTEAKERGLALAQAEAEYQTVKNKRALEMKEEGLAATMIQMLIKGDREVRGALFERDCAQVLYNSSQDAINAYKLDARLLESQIEREYRG